MLYMFIYYLTNLDKNKSINDKHVLDLYAGSRYLSTLEVINCYYCL
jgi:hypothetical protein